MQQERPLDRIYHTLREKITSQQLSPNETLIEYQLAKEYSVSRVTAKKAILMLEQDGLVTVEPNKSARVRSFSRKEVLDFLAFRQELEGYIVRLAVPNFSPEDMRELEGILMTMKADKEAGRLAEYSRNNQRFHNKIMDVCPNRLAVEVTANLKTQMRKYNTRTILVPGRAEHSFAEHSAVLKAIRERSSEDAEQAMRLHLANVQREFEENYDLF